MMHIYYLLSVNDLSLAAILTRRFIKHSSANRVHGVYYSHKGEHYESKVCETMDEGLRGATDIVS